MKSFPLLLSIILLMAAWPVQAEQDCRDVMSSYSVPVQAVAGILAASNVQVFISYPSCTETNSDTFNLGLDANGPLTVGAVAITYAWTVAAITGCTGGTLVQTTLNTAATNNDGSYLPVTMTSNYCHGVIRLLVNAPGIGNIVIARIPWDTMVMNTALEVQNRLCAASAFGAACSTPTINAATTGTMTITNAGSQTITVSGTLDNLNRLCAASTLGSTCSTPTINEAITGTLTATLAGSVAVVNSGSQSITISGALTVHQDPISGAITVTNGGGQTLTVHQDPVSGTLTVHQDPICTPAAHCFVDSTSNTTLIGNSTSTTTLNIPPGFWELFGPILLAVAFAGLISLMGIWVIPGGAAIGMAIFLHAFQQPYPFLVLLQAVAGISLAIFCLIVIAIHILKRKPKAEPRRFFQ